MPSAVRFGLTDDRMNHSPIDRVSRPHAMGSRGGPLSYDAQVFTPRTPDVNEAMYARRPALETALIRAVEGTLHVIVHGESGSGKSWLYKRVFHQQGYAMLVANLASAARYRSLTKEIESAVAVLEEEPVPVKTGYTETKEAEAEANAFGFAKGGLKHTDTYVLKERDPLEAAFASLRARAGSRTCCLVHDNLEMIYSDEELMSELGQIVVLLDDPRVSRHKVSSSSSASHEVYVSTLHGPPTAPR